MDLDTESIRNVKSNYQLKNAVFDRAYNDQQAELVSKKLELAGKFNAL